MNDYNGFYTDISYYLIKNSKHLFFWLIKNHKDKEKLKERILFGTDWWMTELDKYDYKKYCDETKNLLEELSDEIGDDLWYRFTTANPVKFYGLQERADQYADGVLNTEKNLRESDLQYKNLKTDKEKLKSGKIFIKNLKID